MSSPPSPDRPAPRAPTLAEDKITFGQRFAYGFGKASFTLGNTTVKQLAFPIYNITLGLSPTLVGLVLSISRLWDAVTDPAMGSISDNARTRWGRRRPFIVAGAILSALTFPLLWLAPQGGSQLFLFGYFLVTSLLFYTSFTVFSVPYLSFGYELTPDRRERVRVYAVVAYVTMAFGLVWPWLYRFAQAEMFGGTMTGMRVQGVVLGVCFILFALPCALFCRERFKHTTAKQQKFPLKQGIREALKNRPFALIVGITTMTIAGTQMVNSLGIYVNSYYVFGGDTVKGATLGGLGAIVATVGSALSVPLAAYASNRWGKHIVLSVCLSMGVLGSASKFFLFTPTYPWLQFVSLALSAPALAAMWMVIDPMKADIADYDEYLTGMRREGLFASVCNWVEKVALTTVLLLSGVVLDVAGFDVALGGDQTESTFFTIRLLFAGIPAAAMGFGLFLLSRYPLNEKRLDEIRATLEARRGKAH